MLAVPCVYMVHTWAILPSFIELHIIRVIDKMWKILSWLIRVWQWRDDNYNWTTNLYSLLGRDTVTNNRYHNTKSYLYTTSATIVQC